MVRRVRITGAVAAIALGIMAATPVASGAAGSANAAGACTGSMLSGTFKAIPNTAGVGNIEYSLRLVDKTSTSCYVSGIPTGTLLDKHGKALPTHISYAGPATAMPSMKITITPGEAAKATVRFSPDVPGTGEPATKACEQTAYKLRVTPTGGGTTNAPISPPTPVCEKGSLYFVTAFTR